MLKQKISEKSVVQMFSLFHWRKFLTKPAPICERPVKEYGEAYDLLVTRK